MPPGLFPALSRSLVSSSKLKVFKGDRESPLFRDVGKHRQFLSIKIVKKSVFHLVRCTLLSTQAPLSAEFRVPPVYNGPVIVDTRSGNIIMGRRSGPESWRLQQFLSAGAQLLMD